MGLTLRGKFCPDTVVFLSKGWFRQLAGWTFLRCEWQRLHGQFRSGPQRLSDAVQPGRTDCANTTQWRDFHAIPTESTMADR